MGTTVLRQARPREGPTGRELPDDRLAGTIATNVLAYERGARVFRVHDVGPVHDALTVAAATVSPPWTIRTSTTK